jgi:hypothetical protein
MKLFVKIDTEKTDIIKIEINEISTVLELKLKIEEKTSTFFGFKV